MLRILLSVSSMLAACTPSPEKAAMPGPNHVSGAAGQSSSGRSIGKPETAAMESTPEPKAVAKHAASGPGADLPAEARGRLILSTAFVRVGPDGHLTVELRDGRVLALRDVIMRARDYCGVQATGDQGSAKYCGEYAEVAAARPGGGPVSLHPVEPAPGAPAAK